MKSRTRQFFAAAVVTSTLSLLIGGFAVWGSYQSELSIIDKEIDIVVVDIAQNPGNPLAAALVSIEENNFDVTLAFKAPDGQLAPLKESRKAILDGSDELRIRYVDLENSEQLVIAAPLRDINENLVKNLWRLLVFIIFANTLAIFVSMLINRSGALAFERSQRVKMQDFLGDAAHELRTPLTVVKGYAQLLEGNKLEPERTALAFNRLNSEIKRMEMLIADLLILAELGEENSDEFEQVNLSQLLFENIRDCLAVAPHLQIEQLIEEDVTFQGSEKYLQRFISNALTNIRVHTQGAIPVRVTLKNSGEITLIIEDGGPGLPANSYGEQIQGLKRFDRSRSRESGGSGLGLSIMSAVIERHKGRLSLKRSALGGLAIEVQLPRT
jgi:signal transduction histidine kinase